jgi:hypothetical protein
MGTRRTRMIRIDWSPPELEHEGIFARDLEVLANVPNLPDTLVYERVQVALAAKGLLRVRRLRPGFSSLGDHYVRTPAGDRMLARYRMCVRAIGTPSTRSR